MNNIEFVAEFTTNHMGNLNVLLKMVKEAARIGCNYIKMQKKDVETYYTKDKLMYPYLSPYGHTYGEYRSMFEFGYEDMERFNKACQENSIQWFCTIQDIPSLHFIQQFNPAMYKVASTNLKNDDLLQEIVVSVPKSKRLIMSTGGATLEEIDKTINLLHNFQNLVVLHCVSEYPCANENVKLGNISKLIKMYESDRIKIGYSGHEEGYIPTLAAVALGASMIERHFCLSRHSFVHHIECSLEPEEYEKLIHMVLEAESRDLFKEYLSALPQQSLESHFGMTEGEKDFLLYQKYGKKYIHDKSML
jgi:N-acetylneuraminate synthase